MKTFITKCEKIGQLLRVKSWIKNLFIFTPLVFSGHLFILGEFIACSIVFVGFCLVSSSMYILNDFMDKEADQFHPLKSKRYFASCQMSRGAVFFAVALFAFMGLLVCSSIISYVLYVSLVYILLHLLYNAFAKAIIILDVIFVAVGFLLRIWLGASAIFVLPSSWLQMCVFVLALFLGFSKRKYELLILKKKASVHRRSLAYYTPKFLEHLILSCATLTITFYSLYAIAPQTIARVGNFSMLYSVMFVMYGIFRYMFLVNVKKIAEDPVELFLQDFPFMVNLCLWIIYVIVAFYSSMHYGLR